MEKLFYVCIILSILLLFQCSLIEPSTLLVKNKSDYAVYFSVENSDNKDIKIEKGHGKMFFINPGKNNIIFKIKDIEYIVKYSIEIDYLENKKFEFDVNLAN